MRGLPYIARPQLGWRRPKWGLPGSDLGRDRRGGRLERHALRAGRRGLRLRRVGGFSEYACVPEDRLARKPANLTVRAGRGRPARPATAR